VADTVVLDANVLFPFSLRDTLLRLAQQELFAVAWSDRILDEMARNLVAKGITTADQATRLADQMRRAFPEAAQNLDAIAALEPALTNDEHDRHVLAAAIVAGAEDIVTFNIRDFPVAALRSFGKRAHDPYEFLRTVLEMHPEITAQTVIDQAAALRNPPRKVAEVLDLLHLGGVPCFAGEPREHLGLPGRTTEAVLAERSR
jgi:predicted nucleic acid-binding protein